jgi:hypothetical protein
MREVAQAISLNDDRTKELTISQRDSYIRQLNLSLTENRWKFASTHAAMVLVVPTRLLSISLSAFVTSLGIYLGFAYTKLLIPSFGRAGSLVILLVFVVTATTGLAMFYILDALKKIESKPLKQFDNLIFMLGQHNYPVPDATRKYHDPDNEKHSSDITPLDSVVSTTPGRGKMNYSFYATSTDSDAKAGAERDDNIKVLDRPVPESSTLRSLKKIPTVEEHGQSQASQLEEALESFLRAQEESIIAGRTLLEQYRKAAGSSG